jgi:hypothetical protein
MTCKKTKNQLNYYYLYINLPTPDKSTGNHEWFLFIYLLRTTSAGNWNTGNIFIN